MTLNKNIYNGENILTAYSSDEVSSETCHELNLGTLEIWNVLLICIAPLASMKYVYFVFDFLIKSVRKRQTFEATTHCLILNPPIELILRINVYEYLSYV